MRTTQTPAEALASRLYSVDSWLERRIYEDPSYPETQRHGIYLALNGIRNAEDKMASAAGWIRSDMERAERYIAGESAILGVTLTRQAAEFDRAAALRDVHLASLAALLGEEEFSAWKAAKVAARKDPDAEGTDVS